MSAVRIATATDIPAILTMGRRFFAAAGWPRVAQWDEASVATTLGGLIDGRIEGGLLVACDGDPIGMAGFMLFPAYFNFATKVAQEIFWWCEPDWRDSGAGLAMLEAMEADARARGASVFILASVAGMRDVALAKLYARRGYAPAENTFIRKL